LLKGTKVDGVYDRDPALDLQAIKFDKLKHLQVIQQGLKVMDSTAVTMSMDNKLPIIVFKLLEPGNMKKVVLGEKIGTLVESDDHER